ncbi:MAG: ribosome recycling factor [Pseudomonadales bacterium]
MIQEIQADADERMGKSVESLAAAFNKIRTGRASPSLLNGIMVDYYGSDTPLNQVAQVNVEDARTLAISPWEKQMVPVIEKALLKSDLGINPSTSGNLIRVPMPPLTEENRRDLAKVARAEAENGRIAIRNIRRDAISDVRELAKEKEVAEDAAHKAEEDIQNMTNRRVKEIDTMLAGKEKDLLEI